MDHPATDQRHTRQFRLGNERNGATAMSQQDWNVEFAHVVAHDQRGLLVRQAASTRNVDTRARHPQAPTRPPPANVNGNPLRRAALSGETQDLHNKKRRKYRDLKEPKSNEEQNSANHEHHQISTLCPGVQYFDTSKH